MGHKESQDKPSRTTYLLLLMLLFLIGFSLIVHSKMFGVAFAEILTAFGTLIGVGATLDLLKVLILHEGDTGRSYILLQKFWKAWYKTKLEIKNLHSSGMYEINIDGHDNAAFFNGAKNGDVLYWLDTHDPSISFWLSELELAVSRGVKVHMLVMDQKSEALEMRARELGNDMAFIKIQESFNDTLFAVRNRLPVDVRENLNIRLYADLPCAPIFIKVSGNEIIAYSSYYLSEPTSGKMPFIHWHCEADRSDCKCISHQLLSYYQKKWIDAEGPWESRIFPIGLWIYRFQLKLTESKEYVFGKFAVYRQGDGLHAEGEAWYKSHVDREDFIYTFRTHRRGTWRSRGAIYKDFNDRYVIPYELVFQNSIQGDFGGECYKGKLKLNLFNHGILESGCLVNGQLESEGSCESISQQFMDSPKTKLEIIQDTDVDLFRVSQNEIIAMKLNRVNWPTWLKKNFREFDDMLRKVHSIG